MINVMSASAMLEIPIDPLPPGRIAMWLLLASDLMFFVGLVGAFVVIRTGNRDLFSNHVRSLNEELAATGALALLLSSITMFVAVRATLRPRLHLIALLATLLSAGAFIGIQLIEYSTSLSHHTITARDRVTDPLMLFDGRVFSINHQEFLEGYAAMVPVDFDAHIISQNDVARMSFHKTAAAAVFTLPSEIFQDIRYGPGKNIFYAIWYTLTGAHLFHVAVGIIAISVLVIQSLRKNATSVHTELVGLFWQFVVIVGLFLFPLFYLY